MATEAEIIASNILASAIEYKRLYDTTKKNEYKVKEQRLRQIAENIKLIVSSSSSSSVSSFNGRTGAVTLTSADVTGALGYTPGDMLKSIYDYDNDGVVDSAERTEIIVRNSTGTTLTKGTVVYLSGATGNRPNALRAQANSEATSSKTFGFVVSDILNNADGYVACAGTLHDLDTSAFADGVALWLSPTVAGGWITTVPSEPNHSVFLGYVARSHPTQGRVVILIQNGYELNELHDVVITSPSNGQILRYNSTNAYWENWTPTYLTAVPTLDQVTTAGNTTTNAITVGGVKSTADYELRADNAAANTRLGRFKFIRSIYDPTGVGASIDFWRGPSAAEGIIAFSTNPGTAGDNAAERMRITTGGNILIGTTTDSGYKLDINGNLRNINSAYFATSSGNVGIGTISPYDKLEVNGAISATGALSANSAQVHATTLSVESGISYLHAVDWGVEYKPLQVRAQTISLQTGGGSTTDRLFINSTGNVGIGTTSPVVTLNVQNGGSTPKAVFQHGTLAHLGVIIGSTGGGFAIEDNNYFAIWHQDYTNRATETGITERLRITTSGNLLVGTTTDGGYRLDVNGTVRVQNIPAGTADYDRFLVSDSGAVKYRTGNEMLSDIDVPGYVSSRGENLVTNGTGLRKSNYNFSTFTFVGSDAYYSTGSFQDSAFTTARFTDEAIPVDVTQRYRLSVSARQNPYVGARYYVGVSLIDADGLGVNAVNHMYKANTLTTLAAQLNPGDTTVYLTSAANWENGGTAGVNTHLRSFIFWNYVNSFGYAFPPLTYSRNWYGNMWNPGGVNTTTNTITLITPWAGPVIAAGTQLSNGSSGGTFKYITADNVQIPNTWTNYTGIIEGVDTTGTNVTNKFAPGTAAIKILFLNNRDVAGATIYYTNVQFGLDLINPNTHILNGTSLQTANFNISGNGYIGGNVGIGTTSPAYNLHTIGTIAVGTANSLNGTLRIERSGGNTGLILRGSDGYVIGAGFVAVYEPYNYASADHNFNVGHASAGNFNWYAGNNAILNSNTHLMRLTRGGNLLIGTTTDSGFKLDINGTARIQGTTTITPAANTSAIVSTGYSVTGSGTTPLVDLSGTWNTTGIVNALRINITNTASSTSSNLINLQVGGNTLFRVNASSIAGISTGGPIAANGYGLGNGSAGIFTADGTGAFTSTGASIKFSDGLTDVGYSYIFESGQYSNKTFTSGTGGFISVKRGFAPTSGTGVLNILHLQNTINQTGGANGITRGIYVNPTLTSAADFRAIETSAGKIIHQGLTNATQVNVVYYNSATGELTYGAVSGGSTPTLAQVTTAGNTTTNAITVGGLTVDTDTLVVDATNNRVGIGIAAPTDKLHIVDSNNANIFGRITATGTNASAAWVAMNNQNDNVVYRVFGDGVSGSQMGIALARSASLLANLGGSGKFLLGTFSATDFVMGTGNAEKVRIVNSTGNFLIGTTSDNGNKLQVNGTIDGQAFAVNGVNGWTGTIMIATNPPGMQNIDVQGGIIMNVF